MKLEPKIKHAVKLTVKYQIILGIISVIALLFDRGFSFSIWQLSIMGYSIGAFLVIKRCKNKPTESDLFYLKFGSFIFLLLTPLIGYLARLLL